MDSGRLTKAFKALGDPTRLRILLYLKDCADEVAVTRDGSIAPMQGPTVGEVCCHITGIEKATSTISFHLKELREAELITMKRQGKHMICGVNRPLLRMISQFLSQTAERKSE